MQAASSADKNTDSPGLPRRSRFNLGVEASRHAQPHGRVFGRCCIGAKSSRESASFGRRQPPFDPTTIRKLLPEGSEDDEASTNKVRIIQCKDIVDDGLTQSTRVGRVWNRATTLIDSHKALQRRRAPLRIPKIGTNVASLFLAITRFSVETNARARKQEISPTHRRLFTRCCAGRARARRREG